MGEDDSETLCGIDRLEETNSPSVFDLSVDLDEDEGAVDGFDTIKTFLLFDLRMWRCFLRELVGVLRLVADVEPVLIRDWLIPIPSKEEIGFFLIIFEMTM